MFTLCFEIGDNSASHVLGKTKDDLGLGPQVNLLLLLVVWREQLWKPWMMADQPWWESFLSAGSSFSNPFIIAGWST